MARELEGNRTGRMPNPFGRHHKPPDRLTLPDDPRAAAEGARTDRVHNHQRLDLKSGRGRGYEPFDVRAAREAAGLSVAQLAAEAALPEKLIEALEAGQEPGAETLAALKAVLGEGPPDPANATPNEVAEGKAPATIEATPGETTDPESFANASPSVQAEIRARH